MTLRGKSARLKIEIALRSVCPEEHKTPRFLIAMSPLSFSLPLPLLSHPTQKVYSSCFHNLCSRRAGWLVFAGAIIIKAAEQHLKRHLAPPSGLCVRKKKKGSITPPHSRRRGLMTYACHFARFLFFPTFSEPRTPRLHIHPPYLTQILRKQNTQWDL